MLRFWLKRGVDGFRVDALRQLVKDERIRDNPPNPGWCPEQNPYDALLPIYIRTTGSPCSAARPGPSTGQPTNSIITPTSSSSRT